MGETVSGVINYPEGIDILAEKMDFPFPKDTEEGMNQRRMAVRMFIQTISAL